MPVKKKAEKKEESKKVSFKEFKFTGKTFEYTGRVYPSKEGSGKVNRKWGLTLCLNGVFTLKGCQLVETDSNVFITYPQYFVKGKTDNDGTWNSYVYVDKELNEELDAFVSYLMKVVGIDGEEVATTSGSDEELDAFVSYLMKVVGIDGEEVATTSGSDEDLPF